jgi:hypothetical protein
MDFLSWGIDGDAGMEFTTISFLTTDTPTTDNRRPTERSTFLDSGKKTFLQWWTFSHEGLMVTLGWNSQRSLLGQPTHWRPTTDRKIDVFRLRKKTFLQWWILPHGDWGGRWDGTHNDLFFNNWLTDDRQLTTDKNPHVLRLRKKDFFAVKDSPPRGLMGTLVWNSQRSLF